MSHTVRQGARNPLAHFTQRVAAFVAECNYAQTRVTSLRNTPGAYVPRAN
jgi:hypothetical protein